MISCRLSDISLRLVLFLSLVYNSCLLDPLSSNNSVFFFYRAIKEWSQENSWFLWLFLVISLVILTIVSSTADTYQDCPINSMLTMLFTLTSGLTIGSMSSFSFFDTSLQLIYYFDLTLILIFGLILSLILNAFISRQDLNICKWIGYIIVLVCLVIAAYLALIVFGNDYNFVKFLPTVFLASVSSLFYLIVSTTEHLSFLLCLWSITESDIVLSTPFCFCSCLCLLSTFMLLFHPRSHVIPGLFCRLPSGRDNISLQHKWQRQQQLENNNNHDTYTVRDHRPDVYDSQMLLQQPDSWFCDVGCHLSSYGHCEPKW